MSENNCRVSEECFHANIVHLLSAAGVPEDHARRTARILVTAELRGVSTHGVGMLPGNVRRIMGGGITAKPNIREVARFGSLAIIDGDNGIGMATGSVGMELAAEIAKEHGIGWVMVRNGNHYGASGAFAMLALDDDMIGLSIAQCMPKMSIEGTRNAAIGNNPFAIAIPCPAFPLVLDMATSVVAGSRVYRASRAGNCPPEWVARPIEEGESIVFKHFGGAKGSGIAIMTEVLSGVLAGGRVLNEIVIPNSQVDPDHVVFTQAVIDPYALLEKAEFDERMMKLVEQLKSAEPAPGVDEVMLPGERAWRETLKRRRDGIPVAESMISRYDALAEELGTTITWN